MNAPSNRLSGLPTARPEEVGLSRAALQRLDRRHGAGNRGGPRARRLDAVARHGKVAFSQCARRAAARRAADVRRRDLPHLFHDQADRLASRR